MSSLHTYKLGVARSLFALALLLTLLTSDKDVLFTEFTHLNDTSSLLEKCNLFLLLGYDKINVSYLISIIILLVVVLGILPRLTGILHWWITFSFYNSSVIIDVGDQMALIFTFFLIPITLLDTRSNHFKKSNKTSKLVKNISETFWLVLKIQAALIFLENSIIKILIYDEWVKGQNLLYWINHNIFGRQDLLASTLNNLHNIPFISAMILAIIILLKLFLVGALFINDNFIKHRLFIVAVLIHSIGYIYCGLISILLNFIAVLIIYLIDLRNEEIVSYKMNLINLITKPLWLSRNTSK